MLNTVVLPRNLLNFVGKLHKHFKSPQRKALLRRIQKENNENQLILKPYIKTRWLSLGDSLERIIEIWGSLVNYMAYFIKDNEENQEDEEIDIEEEDIEDILQLGDQNGDYNENTQRKFPYSVYHTLLTSQSFYYLIRFITQVVKIINQYNEKF